MFFGSSSCTSFKANKTTKDCCDHFKHGPTVEEAAQLFSYTGPLNGFGTFRRCSAPPSTPFTAAPSPSGLALPAALVHTAHLLKENSERRISAKAFSSRTNASYQMCGRRRRVRAASAFFLLCVRAAAATAFCPVCGWANCPWTNGWLDDGRMLYRKMGWGSPTLRSRSLLSHHLHPSISPSLALDPTRHICVLCGAIAVRSGPPGRRDSGALLDATPKHLHEGS